MNAFFHWSIFLQIFRKCCLQCDNFEILIFINKDWSNDPKVDCITLFNLVKLIEMDMELK